MKPLALFLLALSATALPAQDTAPNAAAANDVILRAMRDELQAGFRPADTRPGVLSRDA